MTCTSTLLYPVISEALVSSLLKTQLENFIVPYTGLFEMIVGVLTAGHLVSPDATPCDFFLWGYVKDQVYAPPLPASIRELKVRIRTVIETITADMLQTVLERTRLSC